MQQTLSSPKFFFFLFRRVQTHTVPNLKHVLSLRLWERLHGRDVRFQRLWVQIIFRIQDNNPSLNGSLKIRHFPNSFRLNLLKRRKSYLFKTLQSAKTTHYPDPNGHYFRHCLRVYWYAYDSMKHSVAMTPKNGLVNHSYYEFLKWKYILQNK